MNIIQEQIVKRVDVLLAELDTLSNGFIREAAVRQKSTSVVELMKQGTIDPEFSARVGAIHVQLAVLRKIMSV